MRTVTKKILAFDYMISKKRYTYTCDPWYEQPGNDHFNSVYKFNGQVNYGEEIFVVCHADGHSGCGGMDEGSPESITIVRIRR